MLPGCGAAFQHPPGAEQANFRALEQSWPKAAKMEARLPNLAFRVLGLGVPARSGVT